MARSTRKSGAELAFLLSQVGYQSAALFAERVAPLELTPPDVGILKVVSEAEGLSQQDLGVKLSMFPSRLVAFLDQLEQRGLLQRLPSPADRRSHALYLSPAGREALKMIGRISRDHQNQLCAALNEAERGQLTKLLRRIADDQKLAPGIHPGFRKLQIPR